MSALARGHHVRIICADVEIAGMVVLASKNGRSLMLSFGGFFRVAGGVYAGSMPVLMDDAGEYRDLLHKQPVQIILRGSEH